MLFPLGNTEAGTHLSLYLDSSPETKETFTFYDSCTFTLVLHGTPDERKGARRRAAARAPRALALTRRRRRAETAHRFTVDRADWCASC
jgi:hypothetical protein